MTQLGFWSGWALAHTLREVRAHHVRALVAELRFGELVLGVDRGGVVEVVPVGGDAVDCDGAEGHEECHELVAAMVDVIVLGFHWLGVGRWLWGCHILPAAHRAQEPDASRPGKGAGSKTG